MELGDEGACTVLLSAAAGARAVAAATGSRGALCHDCLSRSRRTGAINVPAWAAPGQCHGRLCSAVIWAGAVASVAAVAVLLHSTAPALVLTLHVGPNASNERVSRLNVSKLCKVRALQEL